MVGGSVDAVDGAVEVAGSSVVVDPQAAKPKTRIVTAAAKHAAFIIFMRSLRHWHKGNKL